MINDCHVHIGKQSMINQYLTIEDYIKFRENFPYMGKTLFMGTDLEHDSEDMWYITNTFTWAYGLHWYDNEHNDIELGGRMIGVKYHGAYTKKPVTSMSKNVLESLDRNKRILLVHCGRYLEGDIKSNTSYLHALQVARNYPKIKVILAHMGGTDTTVCKKAIEHSISYQNVYFDTSGITTPYIVEYAINRLPIHRILFGSDLPWCSFSAMVWTVADAVTTVQIKDDIFEKNFELLLK